MDKDKLVNEYNELVFKMGQLELEIKEREMVKNQIIADIQKKVSMIKEVLKDESDAQKKAAEVKPETVKQVDEATEMGRS